MCLLDEVPPEFAGFHSRLLEIARSAISRCIHKQPHLDSDTPDWPTELQQHRACFVTLRKQGELRGCIGSLEAHRPLIEDLLDNACAAALQDPRFPPVLPNELDNLHLHISILSPAVAMTFTSEQDLIDQLRPGIDGLILEDGHSRGTFLPSVWDQLPDKLEFIQHLKRKAGLPADYWSDTIKVSHYETESFGE